jgi:hypothetical protein
MKNYTSFIKKGLLSLSALVATGVSLVALTGAVQAAQIPFVPGESLPSIQNPVFNTYTNVPNGVGNEADFVRIRPSTGDVSDNGAGGERNALYVNGHAATCKVGEKFDIRTYVHNGADDDFNNNGTGSSIAHDTEVRMNAVLGTKGATHTFTSQVLATDVSPVTDTARLYCDKEVTLRLVPQSVKVVSKHYGFQTVSDSAVNGSLPIGSHVLGSGDVWGCWDERVLVAYIVEVVEVQVPPVPVYTCDLLSLTFMGNRKYKFEVTATAKNGAKVKEYKFDFNDGSAVVTSASNTVEHKYANDGKFNPKAEVVFTVPTANGSTETKTVSGANCTKPITLSTEEKCPVPGKGDLPKNSPDCKETPVTTIPNTGAGSTIAIIVSAVAGMGAYAHRLFTLKRQ